MSITAYFIDEISETLKVTQKIVHKRLEQVGIKPIL